MNHVGGATGDGFASGSQARKELGVNARRRQLDHLRPGLDDPRKAEVEEVGIGLGRMVKRGLMLLASWEDVTGLIAIPRSGKTAYMAGIIIDAPGSVVASSTKVDTYTLTCKDRAAVGPVDVFNPMNLGGIASTFRWSPIIGCHDPAVAIRRAGYLLSGSKGTAGTEDRNFWDGNNFKLLRSLLYAAAIGHRTMEDLHRWVGSPADPEPLEIIKGYQYAPTGWAHELSQVYNAPHRTRDSVYMTLALTFDFMSDPVLAQAVRPMSEAEQFSAEKLVNERRTLYLLAEEKTHGSVSALFSAITGEIFDYAVETASHKENGRLDPPLTIALDEAATICPVPLDKWTAASGSRGVAIIYAIQGMAQLDQRWGKEGASTIMNNTSARLVFGGLGDDRTLESLSTLCGKRIERTHSHSTSNGKRTTSTSEKEVPVMAPSAIRTLRKNRTLLLYRNLPPMLTDLTPVWDRPDYRKRRKAEEALAKRNQDDNDDPTTLARPPRKPEAIGTGSTRAARPGTTERRRRESDVIDVRSRTVRPKAGEA